MRDVSDNFRRSVGSQTTDAVFLMLLQVDITENDGSESTHYYVNNWEPIDSIDMYSADPVVYQPAAFTLDPGKEISDEAPEVRLRFDSGDRQFTGRMRGLDNKPIVTMAFIISDEPTEFEFGPIQYRASNFSMESTSSIITMETIPILNEPLPATKFTPFLFSGLFKDVSAQDVS